MSANPTRSDRQATAPSPSSALEQRTDTPCSSHTPEQDRLIDQRFCIVEGVDPKGGSGSKRYIVFESATYHSQSGCFSRKQTLWHGPFLTMPQAQALCLRQSTPPPIRGGGST